LRGILSLSTGDANPRQQQRAEARIATEHEASSVESRIITVIERELQTPRFVVPGCAAAFVQLLRISRSSFC
jgi:hypothetical protein